MLIINHMPAGIGCLANIDAIVVELVVQALDSGIHHFFNVLDTRQVLTVDVVTEAAVFDNPAILKAPDERVRILEGCVGGLKVAAVLHNAAGVGVGTVGIQTKGRLVLRLGGKGVQRICTHVYPVANFRRIDNAQSIFVIPCSASLGHQLQAGHNAHRIGHRRINCLTDAAVPVQLQRQCILLRIVDNAFLVIQQEVFVDQRQPGSVIHASLRIVAHNVEVGVNLELRRNGGLLTDTFCQLQQESPRRSVGHIRTGQHVRQVSQSLGDRDLRHIQCDGIGGNHIFARIDNVVGRSTFKPGVGNLTLPGQLTVTAGRAVEIEVILAILVENHIDGRRHLLIQHQSRRHLNRLDARLFNCIEDQAIHRADSRIADGEGDVILDEGSFLTGIASLQRQFNALAIDTIDLVTSKVDLIGNNHRQRLLTDDHIPLHQIGLELTVLLGNNLSCLLLDIGVILIDDDIAGINDFRHFRIGHCPGCILGQSDNVVGCAQTGCAHRHLSAHRHEVVVRFNQCTFEGLGAGCSGNHHQGCGDTALHAVGRTVDEGKLIIASPAGDKGRGTAAVQVHSRDTAGKLHDLSNFDHGAAAAPGHLATIQNHEHDTTGGSDTNGSTACTVIVVVGGGNLVVQLAVNNQHGAEARKAFLQLTLVDLVVFVGCANHSLAALGDAKEAVTIRALVFLTMHDQQTAGFAGAHVEACTVHRNYGCKVLDVVLALRIGVVLFSRLVGLIQHSAHLPAFVDITVMIVDHDVNILSSQIRIAQVVDHVLAIGRGGLVDLHADARRQQAVGGLVVGQVGIVRIVNPVASQDTQVISECIADRLTPGDHVFDVVELTGTLQGGDDAVGGVGIVDRLTNCTAGTNIVETVHQQEVRTGHIVQRHSKVVQEEFRHVAGCIVLSIQGFHDVERIKVAIVVIQSKGVFMIKVVTKQLCADDSNQRLEIITSALDQVLMRAVVGCAQQVNQVACPAANVGMVHTAIVVVGDVHGTEHMAKVNLESGIIGQSEQTQVLQARDLNHLIVLFLGVLRVILVFLLSNILSKALVLVASHDTPGTGVVTLHTSTDVLDDQIHRIGTGSLLGILHSPLFQDRQILDHLGVGVDGLLAQCLNGYLGGVRTTAASLVCLPAFSGKGRVLRRILGNGGVAIGQLVLECGDQSRCNGLDAAHRAFLALRPAILSTGRRDLVNLYRLMAKGLTLRMTAIPTGFRRRTGCRRHVMSVRICLRITTSTVRIRVLTGSRAPDMSRRDGRLRNENRITDGAVSAVRQAILIAGFCIALVDDDSMTGRSELILTRRTTAFSCTHPLAPAILSTGRQLLFHHLHGMCSLDSFCPGLRAASVRTGVRHQACLGTGMNGVLNTLIPGMAGFSNGLLSNQDFVADRAMLTFSQASLGTGRHHGLVNHFSVTIICDLHICRIVTSAAVFICRPTNLSTGYFLFIDLNQVMSQHRDYF